MIDQFNLLPKKEKYIIRNLNNSDFIIEKDNTSFCKVCKVVIKGAGFHIKRHANSAVHIKKYNSAKTTPKIDSTIKKDPKVCLAERNSL
jgi:hypothetical protein